MSQLHSPKTILSMQQCRCHQDCYLRQHKHDFLFSLNHGSICPVLERNVDQMSSVANIFTCALKPGCSMSHIWLPTLDCKITLFD